MWFMMKSPARDTSKFSNLCRELPMIQYLRVKGPFLEKKNSEEKCLQESDSKNLGSCVKGR